MAPLGALQSLEHILSSQSQKGRTVAMAVNSTSTLGGSIQSGINQSNLEIIRDLEACLPSGKLHNYGKSHEKL